MTCSNKYCPVFIVCQKKHKPCQSKPFAGILQNGYRAMAAQEQKMRMSSIDYRGNF